MGRVSRNVVALHLSKAVRTWTAVGEGSLDLAYIRDKQKRGGGFRDHGEEQAKVLVECKLSDPVLSPNLLWFQESLNVPVAIQIVQAPGHAEPHRRRWTHAMGGVRGPVVGPNWCRRRDARPSRPRPCEDFGAVALEVQRRDGRLHFKCKRHRLAPGPLGGIPGGFYESPGLGSAAQILHCRETELMQREISILTATGRRCDIFRPACSCGQQNITGD